MTTIREITGEGSRVRKIKRIFCEAAIKDKVGIVADIGQKYRDVLLMFPIITSEETLAAMRATLNRANVPASLVQTYSSPSI